WARPAPSPPAPKPSPARWASPRPTRTASLVRIPSPRSPIRLPSVEGLEAGDEPPESAAASLWHGRPAHAERAWDLQPRLMRGFNLTPHGRDARATVRLPGDHSPVRGSVH